MQTQVAFLGFIVVMQDIAANPEKVRAIRDWPEQRFFLRFVVFMGWPPSIGNSLRVLVPLWLPSLIV